jgi:cob(I)alamin adenosyltransferase
MKESTWPSGERQGLRKLGIELLVMGEGFYKILNDQKSEEQHKGAALKALAALREKTFAGQYRLVVADELGSAVEEKILERRPVEKFLKDHARDKKAKLVHLIWTGHQKINWMLRYADLVTEMKMVRHPYYKGIIATRGLDY